MLKRLSLSRFFGTANQRALSELQPLLSRVQAQEPALQKLSDAELQARTASFRERLARGAALEELLVPAFATVREASRRVLGMRPFDVQILGGLVLHRGQIAEMKTGEGKTLVATLPGYLNALTGQGVHLVTVNEYLATRDAQWMGQIYRFLGLTTGVLRAQASESERREAYQADITYGTNNEFGFDYLRDNLKLRREDMVQRVLHFAIVDEVDSILIDEARTPLIISGPADDITELYQQVDTFIPQLTSEHYETDEKGKNIFLTDAGSQLFEAFVARLGLLKEGTLYDVQNIALLHHASVALRAHRLFHRDKDYIVSNGKIVIVDEFTGRTMEGRRYGEGLHQALEAKEKLQIERENQTLASITFQNYFRLYQKLAGMTGTAVTEASEFKEIYELSVVEIPTHLPMVRDDQDDKIYRTNQERDEAVLATIQHYHAQGQPILVGTVSIEKSESLSRCLKKAGLAHKVLNARQNESEALIIAEAGRRGGITIATNMAGRGTDIQLGGPPPEAPAPAYEAERKAILEAGGLVVVGTERHESRRIDNQLRGRSGRQGDPGTSVFLLSLEDDLIRIFVSGKLESVLAKLGLKNGESIEHPWVSKAIARAQSKVEERNFEIRKQLLKYDNVVNDQRKVVFANRLDLMQDKDVGPTLLEMRQHLLNRLIEEAMPPQSMPATWDLKALNVRFEAQFGLGVDLAEMAQEEGVGPEELKTRLADMIEARLAERRELLPEAQWLFIERTLLLQVLDQVWKEHLVQLDHLRHGIGLRAYGQRDPLNEYKREAFLLFETMLTRFQEIAVMHAMRLRPVVAPWPPGARPDGGRPPDRTTPQRPGLSRRRPEPSGGSLEKRLVGRIAGAGRPGSVPVPGPGRDSGAAPGGSSGGFSDKSPETPASPVSPEAERRPKIGRNELCPCGSGKKWKKCHGRPVRDDTASDAAS